MRSDIRPFGPRQEHGEKARRVEPLRDHLQGRHIDVVLNGEHVTSMDMALWTEKGKNPDGSTVPSWLSRPAAELETKGRIGFQGKHAAAPIFFRNIRIKQL